MCIKVELGIRVEILPVVFKKGTEDSQREPFILYRPEQKTWEDGYARSHQVLLTEKNKTHRTGGNFIPAVKLFKHLRSNMSLHSVSFHIECLLYNIPDTLFVGTTADYMASILGYIADTAADSWYAGRMPTPCADRDIFTNKEWSREQWRTFHQCASLWARAARIAQAAKDKTIAIETWQMILGDDFFPSTVS
jgi:hypothetical protein